MAQIFRAKIWKNNNKTPIIYNKLGDELKMFFFFIRLLTSLDHEKVLGVSSELNYETNYWVLKDFDNKCDPSWLEECPNKIRDRTLFLIRKGSNTLVVYSGFLRDRHKMEFVSIIITTRKEQEN